MAGIYNQYILYPFAVDSASLGSGSVIPTTGGSSGSMSYEYGFTPNYELELGVAAGALPIPRNQFNQLMFDLTTALKILQDYGYPNWIAPATGSPLVGGPANYPLNATVRYPVDGNIYQSVVASNTSVPGADTNWILINGNNNSVPTGTIIDFAGRAAPYGFMPARGQTISRTTYAKLYTAITYQQTCSTNSTDTLTVATTEQMVAGMAIEGSSTIPAGTTILAIIDGTTLTMSQSATGTNASETVTFFFWGNGDGSTTFKIPNLTGIVTAGSDGRTVSGIGLSTTVVGQNNGDIDVTLTNENMPSGVPVSSSTITGFQVGGGVTNRYAPTDTPLNGWSGGSGDPVSIVQPTTIVLKCIKYV